jgi:hypothetical protein
MTNATPDGSKDPTKEELENDMAATRERLSENIEALEDKLNVPKQAKTKVNDAKEQVGAKAKVVTEQLKAYPRAAMAVGGTLVALVVLIAARRGRSR